MQHVGQYSALKWDKMTPNTALLTQSCFIIKHYISKCLQSLNDRSKEYFSSKKDVFLPIFAFFFFFPKAGASFKSSL